MISVCVWFIAKEVTPNCARSNRKKTFSSRRSSVAQFDIKLRLNENSDVHAYRYICICRSEWVHMYIGTRKARPKKWFQTNYFDYSRHSTQKLIRENISAENIFFRGKILPTLFPSNTFFLWRERNEENEEILFKNFFSRRKIIWVATMTDLGNQENLASHDLR
jgi:hypothetical protein